MLITTSFDLPGYEIVAVQGEVVGLTKLLVQSRNEAMARAGQMPHQQPYEPYVSEWGAPQPQGPVRGT